MIIAILIFIWCIFVFLILNDYKNTLEIMAKTKERRLNFEKKYIEFLERECNTKLIYNKFSEEKIKLPDVLHNIMIAYSLANDYYALVYIRELDLKTGRMKTEYLPKKVCK